MHKRHLVLALLASTALLMTTSPALAQGFDEIDPVVMEDARGILDDANTHARRSRYKQAIADYKKVLSMVPDSWPSVYYNLAEIKKFQKDCTEARLLYKRYLEVSPNASDKRQVLKEIASCEKSIPAKGDLQLRVLNVEKPLIFVNGVPVTRSNVLKAPMKAGKYQVKIVAKDYQTFVSEIEVLSGQSADLEASLEKQVFFGKLTIDVNVEGASVSIAGKSLGASPVKEAVQLEAGPKHFLELTKPGYHRWIRNIVVQPGEAMTLNVRMQKLSDGP